MRCVQNYSNKLELRDMCSLNIYIYLFCRCLFRVFGRHLYDIKYSYLIQIINTQIVFESFLFYDKISLSSRK